MYYGYTNNHIKKLKAYSTNLKRVPHIPNNIILDWSKAFTDHILVIKILKMMIFVFDKVEITVGKGENAGYQHFLLFTQCFQKAFYSGWLKVRIVW